MAEKLITKIRTEDGDLQIDYNALANKPSAADIGAAPVEHTHDAGDIGAAPVEHTHTASDIGAAPVEHTHTVSDIGSGCLPLNKGGTGTTIDMNTAPPRSIIVKATEGYDQLYYTPTKNGAFYATQENGKADFGTLPIAQGGTGATNAAGAMANLGAVNKAGDTMTGKLTVPSSVIVTSATYPFVEFKKSADENMIGAHFYDVENRRHVLRDYAADMDGASTRYSESYYFPTADTGLTSNKSYSVLTTKNAVSIAQGGTGATNGATGLKNLFAAGATVLTEGTAYQYGTTLPPHGNKGRIFFKKVSG
jgi:hypothetical protein